MLADAMETTPKVVESKPRPNFVFSMKEFIWDSIWFPILREGNYNVFSRK